MRSSSAPGRWLAPLCCGHCHSLQHLRHWAICCCCFAPARPGWAPGGRRLHLARTYYFLAASIVFLALGIDGAHPPRSPAA
eukprot:12712706-Alexandrium_andersonii.AAC.1